jgi:hypothetical protein
MTLGAGPARAGNGIPEHGGEQTKYHSGAASHFAGTGGRYIELADLREGRSQVHLSDNDSPSRSRLPSNVTSGTPPRQRAPRYGHLFGSLEAGRATCGSR